LARVLLFGRLGDIAGWRERVLDAEPATLSALRARLADENPALGEALEGVGVQACIDKVLTRGDALLTSGMEIAFLPPMSGG
jgi:molybdopterin synthase sulfur carrier subunit